jgi:D-proline reductase (dithiol) PrdB
MVRLSDLNPAEARHMRERTVNMEPVAAAPWITPTTPKDARVAIVSTAGLHRRDDPPFKGGPEYRLLPADTNFSDVVISHISTNFDRSAFQQDPNVWFPLDRLHEMVADGEIGGVSQWHYSFMGAQPSHAALEDVGEEVGAMLAADEVDVALLVPV